MDPEIDVGQDSQVEAPPPKPVPHNERPVDGPGSGRNQIRKQLEESVRTVREAAEGEPPAKPAARPKAKPAAAGGYQSRAAEMREGTEADPAVAGQQEPDPAAAEPKEAAPDAYNKELKATWAQVPEAWRQAVVKREQDVMNGVAQIRQQYAELDNVLGPRAELIKRHGHTPAQAVNQLFAWFDALGGDPDRIKKGEQPIAFISLAKSFGLDKLIEESMKSGQPAAAGQPAQGQPPGEIPPAVQQYISGLEQKLGQFSGMLNQRFGTLEEQLAANRMEKTTEVLSHWAKDKPHFESVKMMMAHLLESGAVPPLEGGRADLDKAYDMALYAVPEVRQQVLAEQEAARVAAEKTKREAETKLQQAQADKARRASGGLVPGAPGQGLPPLPGGKPGKKSVRESLNDAISELS